MYNYMSSFSKITIDKDTQLEGVFEIESLIINETKNTKNTELIEFLSRTENLEKSLKYALHIINSDNNNALDNIPQNIVDSIKQEFEEYFNNTNDDDDVDTSDEELNEDEQKVNDEEKKSTAESRKKEREERLDSAVRADLQSKIDQKYPTVATNMLCSYMGKRGLHHHIFRSSDDNLKKIMFSVLDDVKNSQLSPQTMNNLMRIAIKSNEGYRDEFVKYVYQENNIETLKTCIAHAAEIPSFEEFLGPILVHQFNKDVDQAFKEHKQDQLGDKEIAAIESTRQSLWKYIFNEAFFVSEENSSALLRLADYALKYGDSDYPTDTFAMSTIARLRQEAMNANNDKEPVENFLLPFVDDVQTQLFHHVKDDGIFENGIHLLQTMFKLNPPSKMLEITYSDSDSEFDVDEKTSHALHTFLERHVKLIIQILGETPPVIYERACGSTRLGSKRLALVKFLNIINPYHTLPTPLLKELMELFWEFPRHSILHYFVMRIFVSIFQNQDNDVILEVLKETNMIARFIQELTPTINKPQSIGQLGQILNMCYELTKLSINQDDITQFIESHDQVQPFLNYVKDRKYIEQVYKLDTALPEQFFAGESSREDEDDEFDFDSDDEFYPEDQNSKQEQDSNEKTTTDEAEQEDSTIESSSPSQPQEETEQEQEEEQEQENEQQEEQEKEVEEEQEKEVPSQEEEQSPSQEEDQSPKDENVQDDVNEDDGSSQDDDVNEEESNDDDDTPSANKGILTPEGLRPHTPATTSTNPRGKRGSTKKKSKKSKLPPIRRSRNMDS